METNGSFRKLKIAIVLDWFLPSKGGESYLVWLAQELSRRGHDVHVFAIEAEKDPAASYQVHLIPVLRWPRSLRMLSFLFNSGRLVRRDTFDIVHGVGLTLAMNVFNPHGGVEQAYLRQEFRSISNRFYRLWKRVKLILSPRHHLTLWIQRRQYRSPGVKRIIAISQMIKRNISEQYGPVVKKVAVVFNSVDLDRFHPRNRDLHRAEKRSALAIPADAVVLLFVGNNYRLKGLEPLMAAVGFLRAKVPTRPVRLLVAGRGQAARYRRKAGRLGVADLVLFLGPVRNIEQYYAASDIYVHPTFYDSCSLTVLEALASGLPVVTTRFNGAADAIVSEDGGRVIDDPSNIHDLAESIAHYFDEEVRTKARAIARQWMEQVPPGYNMEQTLRVYDDVVRETERERAASAGMGTFRVNRPHMG